MPTLAGGTTPGSPRSRDHPMSIALGPRRFAAVRCLLFAVVCAGAVTGTSRGGGGPENVFLVVNSASVDSIGVANAFVASRGIPPINILMLPWQDNVESTTIARFRNELLAPIFKAIESRRLATQIDCIAWSSDFPWRIDFKDELPADLAAKDSYPSGSLTGMTMLYSAVQSGGPMWLDPESNDYYRPLARDGVPATTQGFRSWYGWGDDGGLPGAGGTRYQHLVKADSYTPMKRSTTIEVDNPARSAPVE